MEMLASTTVETVALEAPGLALDDLGALFGRLREAGRTCDGARLLPLGHACTIVEVIYSPPAWTDQLVRPRAGVSIRAHASPH